MWWYKFFINNDLSFFLSFEGVGVGVGVAVGVGVRVGVGAED